MIRVTQDDLLNALRDALEVLPGDAPTVPEIASQTGVSEKRIREALRRVMAEGRLECVRVRRMALDGRAALVPGYRLKVKAKR